MLITIELENAIDHLFRGEELLPSAEESLKEMDFESLAQGIKFFSKPVYVYTAYPDGDPDGGYRGPLLFPFPATLLYSKTYEEMICDSGVIIKHIMELWILDDMTFARFDTLGAGYSAYELRAIISGTKRKQERKRKAKAKDSVSLLVDIQEKMQQGKGPGYARWAKSFNLKQMAQTVLYLQEHKLYDYEELSQKAEASKDQFNILSVQIKDAEKRMTEISVMKKQLINYSKTRQVYENYRIAGYSKKYLAEHESEIILHKAAKKYLDEAGLKHFPSVKQLDAEYAGLLSKKKEIYVAYRKAREESRELLTVKANVDRVLGIEKDDAPEKEAPSETRS